MTGCDLASRSESASKRASGSVRRRPSRSGQHRRPRRGYAPAARPPTAYIVPGHSSTHPEGWRDMALRNPGNLPQGNGAKSIRLQLQRPGRCGRAVSSLDLRPQTPAEVFHICRQSRFAARNVTPPIRWTRGTSASSCFGPLEVAYATRPDADPEALKRRIQAGPHSLWRYGDFLPVQTAPQGVLQAGWTPLLRADRLAAELGLEDGLDQERRRQPDPLVQGPGGVDRAGPRP